MLPLENEPHGLNENQKRNDSELENDQNEKLEKEDTDFSQNDIAGNASGNMPDEAEENHTNKSTNDNNGKGFMGDFAKPQHDD